MRSRQRWFEGLIREIAGVTFARFGYLIIAFLAEVYIARLLGPSGKGLLATALVYPLLLLPVLELGIRQAAVVVLGGKYAPAEQVVGTVVSVWLVVAPAGLLLAFFLTQHALPDDVAWTTVLIAALLLPVRLVIAYASGLALGARRLDVVNSLTVLPPIILLITVAGIAVPFRLTLSATLAAYLLAGLATASVAIRFVMKTWRLRLSVSMATLRAMLRLGFVFALSLSLVSLNYRADIAILAALRPADEVGLYSVATQLSETLLQVPAAIGVVIFARSAAASDRDAFSRRITALVGFSFAVAVVAAGVLATVADSVVRVAFGDEFAGSAWLLTLLLPGTVLVGVFKLVTMDFAGRGRPWLSVAILAPTVLLNISLNFALIPVWGTAGAAVASTVAYSVAGLVGVGVFLRIAQQPIRHLFPSGSALRGLLGER